VTNSSGVRRKIDACLKERLEIRNKALFKALQIKKRDATAAQCFDGV
jgi:hypothetical protein